MIKIKNLFLTFLVCLSACSFKPAYGALVAMHRTVNDQRIVMIEELKKCLDYKYAAMQGHEELQSAVTGITGLKYMWKEDPKAVNAAAAHAETIARHINRHGLGAFTTDPMYKKKQISKVKKLMSLPFQDDRAGRIENMSADEITKKHLPHLNQTICDFEDILKDQEDFMCGIKELLDALDSGAVYLNFLHFHELRENAVIQELAQRLMKVKKISQETHQKMREVKCTTILSDEQHDDYERLLEDQTHREFLASRAQLQAASEHLVILKQHSSIDSFIEKTKTLRSQKRNLHCGRSEGVITSDLANWYLEQTDYPLTDELAPFAFYMTNYLRFGLYGHHYPEHKAKLEKIKQKMVNRLECVENKLECAEVMSAVEIEATAVNEIPGSLAQLTERKQLVQTQRTDFQNKQANGESVALYADCPWAQSDEGLRGELANINNQIETIKQVKEELWRNHQHYGNLMLNDPGAADNWAKDKPLVVSEAETRKKLEEAELGKSPQAEQYLAIKHNSFPYSLQIQMLEMSLENIDKELNPADNEEDIQEY